MTDNLTTAMLLALALGYLLGAIPFGLLLTKFAGLGDIRAIGSGNIGATNVLRTGNKGLAAATLALDVLKGTAAVLIARAGYLGHDPSLDVVAFSAALGAFIGHIYPVWLGFRGGKGVATYIGVLIGLYWPAALAFVIVWLLLAVVFRYSSLSALVASGIAPAVVWALGRPQMALMLIPVYALLIWKHRANIERLLQGREPRIGAKS